jgi:hypothetical protein
VIVGGLERQPIFRDDEDRWRFHDRFSDFLQETQTACLARALIPNTSICLFAWLK